MQSLRRIVAAALLLAIVACNRSDEGGAGSFRPGENLPTLPELEEVAGLPPADVPARVLLLRAMSWNLEWFPGRDMASSETDKLIQLTAAREVVAAAFPDILCMQEILDEEALEDLISALPGFKVQAMSQFSGAQQVAIASKISPVIAYQKKFSVSGASPPRGFAFAAYKEGEEYLFVYSVHLKSNRGGIEENIAKREDSARQLIAHMALAEAGFRKQGGKRFSVILAGDFNTDPYDSRFSVEKTCDVLGRSSLSSCWEDRPIEERITWPADGTYPDACFDHFFTREIAEFRAATIFGSEMASDHRAILLDFKWGQQVIEHAGPEMRVIRTWEDQSGKFSVVAEFVRLEGDGVILKQPNGKLKEIPLSLLSTSDQKYVQQMDGR